MRTIRTYFWHISIVRYSLIAIAMHALYYSVACIAQPRGIFDNYVEHRLKLRGRACDYTQNLAGGGLLFQRFRELTITFLQLFVLRLLPLQRFGELLAQLRNRLRWFSHRHIHHG